MTLEELKKCNVNDKCIKNLKKKIIKIIKEASIKDLVEFFEFAKYKSTLEKSRVD